MSDLNWAILSVAPQFIGKGEEGQNNQGFWINIFRRGMRVWGGGEWCSQYCSFVVELACYGAGKRRPYRVRHRSAKKFFYKCVKYGKIVTDPEPGDIELRKRTKGHHVEIVSKVRENGSRTNIAGNVGSHPAVVRHVWRRRLADDGAHVAFVRLKG